MAVAPAPSPNSKAPVAEGSKRKMVSSSGQEEEPRSDMKSGNSSSQPPKRNKSPGVRVIHGRVYDSQNGTTCHQDDCCFARFVVLYMLSDFIEMCRQKTCVVSVNCKNQARAKPCTLKYCYTCLLNRYGEKAEDVALLDEWNCPRCRDVCNCSICMKKRGHQPTGMLVQMAKAGGFSSVSDMLHVKGPQSVGPYKRVKETCASPRKLSAPAEGTVIISPKKPGKENLFDGKTDLNANPSLPIPSSEEKPKKMKQKRLDGVNKVSGVEINHALNEKNEKKLKPEGLDKTGSSLVFVEKTSHLDKKKHKKLKIEGSKEIVEGNVNGGAISKVNGVQQEVKEIKTSIHDGNGTEEKNIVHEGEEGLDGRSDQKANQQAEDKKYLKAKKKALNLCNNSFEAIIPLPTGSELVTIVGVDLPKEDAGNALQLLEFCATFGKILDVRKGQAEAVLRDLIKGRNPTHGNDSWLKALKSCIPKSQHILEHVDCTDKRTGGYDNLDSSMKLKLLVLLCDEILGTEKVRNWINEENVKFAEKRKEAKEKLAAAKDKEKILKQKMQDDVAKAIIARDGVPLTMLEHDAIVSKIKNKTAEAHAEMIACKQMIPIDKEKPDAVRTEPIFRDNNGHVYWKLKGFSDAAGVLHQDIGTGDHTAEQVDRWFHYDAEQMDLIEKHIKVSRLRFKRDYKNCGMVSV
ncbi:Zinc-finger domain of monoamine-oxidase A repressor R1 [Cynara cardunculus var. scolymus]|uniref:Zinc-finger domain of monoamine-oxidase A repressor R1 n=1 Tax=Cynara cardunculus var. scolymus TaxID=59895 RepID=A0A103XKE9_CYNCS|nr:Zinc-finger domain of monoamine-oxidase A repressor R1 [Cynara cardunculus var. scolymus]